MPGENINQLLAVSSPWIDLCSPDPLIQSFSRQVLNMEVAYAAFCGFGNLIVLGPNLHHDSAHADGLARYARAIQEALTIGSYISLSVLLPMVDHPITDFQDVVGRLTSLRRQEYASVMEEGDSARKADLFGTWDAWHTIRTVCKYSQRLFVGKRNQLGLNHLLGSLLPSPPENTCAISLSLTE